MAQNFVVWGCFEYLIPKMLSSEERLKSDAVLTVTRGIHTPIRMHNTNIHIQAYTILHNLLNIWSNHGTCVALTPKAMKLEDERTLNQEKPM